MRAVRAASLLAVSAALAAALVAAGCAGRAPDVGAPAAPAADGRVLVGRSADTDTFLAVVVGDAGDAVAYACDGTERDVSIATWFFGALDGGAFHAASEDGFELSFTLGDTGATGTLRTSEDDAEAVSLAPAGGVDGLWWADTEDGRAGWILDGGEQRGAIRISSAFRTTTSIAPASGATTTRTSDGTTATRASASTEPTTDVPPTDPSVVDGFLTPHNAVRSQAAPAPAPALAPMAWSDDLAEMAQTFVNGCVFGHNANRGSAGELIASTSTTTATPGDMVALWSAEAGDYDYGANACAAGHSCDHYTQLVWRTSTLVGCGIATCSFGRFAVCDYQSPGNVFGERPY